MSPFILPTLKAELHSGTQVLTQYSWDIHDPSKGNSHFCVGRLPELLSAPLWFSHGKLLPWFPASLPCWLSPIFPTHFSKCWLMQGLNTCPKAQPLALCLSSTSLLGEEMHFQLYFELQTYRFNGIDWSTCHFEREWSKFSLIKSLFKGEWVKMAPIYPSGKCWRQKGILFGCLLRASIRRMLLACEVWVKVQAQRFSEQGRLRDCDKLEPKNDAFISEKKME